jgi:hypothetical protein
MQNMTVNISVFELQNVFVQFRATSSFASQMAKIITSSVIEYTKLMQNYQMNNFRPFSLSKMHHKWRFEPPKLGHFTPSHQKNSIAPTALFHQNFFRAKASWYLRAGLVRRNLRNMTVSISVNAWIPSFLKPQFNPTFRPHITSNTSNFSQFNTQHW